MENGGEVKKEKPPRVEEDGVKDLDSAFADQKRIGTPNNEKMSEFIGWGL